MVRAQATRGAFEGPCTGFALALALALILPYSFNGAVQSRVGLELTDSLIDFRGNPGIRALYQAIGIPTLRSEPPILGRGCDEAHFSEKNVFQWKGGRQFSESGVW